MSMSPTVRLGDRYTLLRPLAVGGMAEIYLARQDAMAGFEKEVVIKRLKSEHARDERLVEMFLDEARIGALLNHPNIVHVYDVGQDRALPYIAMEYIRGQELHALCRRGLSLDAFLPLAHAVDLIRQAAAGMGYFHAAEDMDIVHCDISPTNLLITADGFLKIIDFGIARARNQSRLGPDAVPGKLSYMSPEQAQNRPLDNRSDIFSLGVVLYEITVGQRLFRGRAAEVIERLTGGDIAPPTYVNQSFPGALESIVMRALETEPADRYQSAYDLADDLEAFLHEEKLQSGPVRIARYLDSLAAKAGGQRRPELVAEAEILAEQEDLEFDREVFAGFRPEGEGVRAWEDLDEGENQVADVLGIEVDRVRRGGRKPTRELPAFDAADAFDGDTVEQPARGHARWGESSRPERDEEGRGPTGVPPDSPVQVHARNVRGGEGSPTIEGDTQHDPSAAREMAGHIAARSASAVTAAQYPRIADSELPPGAAADSVWQARRRQRLAAKAAKAATRVGKPETAPAVSAAATSTKAPDAGKMALLGTVIVVVVAALMVWLWTAL